MLQEKYTHLLSKSVTSYVNLTTITKSCNSHHCFHHYLMEKVDRNNRTSSFELIFPPKKQMETTSQTKRKTLAPTTVLYTNCKHSSSSHTHTTIRCRTSVTRRSILVVMKELVCIYLELSLTQITAMRDCLMQS